MEEDDNNMPLIGEYRCNQFNKILAEGDFIAILGNAPSADFAASVGRVDKMLAEIGPIYRLDCFIRRQRCLNKQHKKGQNNE